MSNFFLDCAVSLSGGNRQSSVKPVSSNRSCHCYYSTAIECDNKTLLPMDVHIYSPMNGSTVVPPTRLALPSKRRQYPTIDTAGSSSAGEPLRDGSWPPSLPVPSVRPGHDNAEGKSSKTLDNASVEHPPARKDTGNGGSAEERGGPLRKWERGGRSGSENGPGKGWVKEGMT
ncbi:hypothetical protein JB92DRAFT_2839220 [Gautieria morchelliformis]|nr:hypothetical protein JB92DRAFT_2839220 [Gautieria morchelliformis]